MINNILLSIIVPVYNVEKYLCRCIDSILQQASSEIEIILVDDGSTDESSHICDEYARNSNLVTVIHKKNEGASSARNKGLDIAKGKFIAFVDSDDWVEPCYIDTVSLNIEKQDLLVFSYVIDYTNAADAKLCILNCADEKTPQEAVRQLEQSGAFNFVTNKIYRKEIIERMPRLRFIINAEPGEDLLFNCEYIKRVESASFSNSILYHWMRQGEDTLANKYRSDLIEKNKRFIKARNDLYASLEMITPSEQKLLAQGNLDYVLACIPNMYRVGSVFQKKQRINFYKAILDSVDMQRMLQEVTPRGIILKLFKVAYGFKSARIMDSIYFWIMKWRYCFEKAYHIIRKYIE